MLILGQSVKTGEIIPIKPIAVLKLLDEGEQDDKIIAVPALKKDQIFKAESYKVFLNNYPEAKEIIELWFLSYDKDNSLKICLLYTSPSPRDRQKTRMPSSA